MTQCETKLIPMQTARRRLGRGIAVAVLAGQVLATSPLWAQDATPTPAPSVAPTTETVAPTAPTALEPAPAQPAAPATAQSEPAAPTVTAPAADAAAPISQAPAIPAPEVAAAPEPVIEPPSLFEDPAGAIAHMLTPQERNPALPHDLSPWGMFMAADIVVKAVMLGLAFASLVTWTIFVAKTLELMGANRNARATLKAIQRARSLDDAIDAAGSKGPASSMLTVARNEMELSEPVLAHAGGDGLKERVTAALTRIEARAGRKIAIGTGVLATIGSTSPFVGLFGTVWGIMNSFIGISKSQTTNLAVVAPGIAEALLATAIGLVAAIPAVIIYNHFARQTARYKHLLGDAATGVEILVSRDLDYRQVPHTASNVISAVRPAAAE